MSGVVEDAIDRKNRIDANKFVDALKQKIKALTTERDALIARYEPHNVKAAKPKKPTERKPVPFRAHAYALKKYVEACEDIAAGFGRGDYDTEEMKFGSYWAMMVHLPDGLPRPEPQTEAEVEEARGHYDRMWQRHLAGGRIGS